MIKSLFVNNQICLSRHVKYQICNFQLLDLYLSIIKSIFFNNMIWSGGLHPAREDYQTGGCGSFSKTLNSQLGLKSILFTQGDLVWPEKCGKPEIYLLPSLNVWGTSLPKLHQLCRVGFLFGLFVNWFLCLSSFHLSLVWLSVCGYVN